MAIAGRIQPNSNVLSEVFEITLAQFGAKQLTLSNTPKTSGSVFIDVIGGGPLQQGVDFVVSGSVISWNGYGLDTTIGVGDLLRVTCEYEG